MKFRFPFFLLLVLPFAGPARADEPAAPPATRLAVPIVVSRFVPPVPAPPKDIPDIRVHAASVRHFPGYRISALLGEPSTLPDIPRPVPKPPPSQEELERRQELFSRYRPPVYVHFGSVTYDRRMSLVHWRHPQDPAIGYEAALMLDFGVFSNVGNYLYNDIPHSLFLLHHDIDTRVLHRFGGWARLPDLPELPAGGYLVTRGDPRDAAGMHPLHSILALFAAEKDALLQAREQRLEYEREHRRWRELHPESKEPVSATYWLRPHRGSRYIAPEGE